MAHVEKEAPLLPLLALAHRRLGDDLQKRLADAGFADQRVAHHQVFAHVPPEGIRLTDLADRAHMTKQAMAELVADLERLGYLERAPDPADGRAKRIRLTGEGRDAVAAADAAFAAQEAAIADAISPKRAQQLRRALLGILE
jgi:DNA-binding MarR family transcriptional regulator